jgi:putative component of toxin-antitoxin plasmid stabilization module
MNNEWPIENDYAILGKFKRFAKDYARENESLFANLDKVLRILRQGHKMGSFQIGFFRSEGDGVFRIGQTGVESAKESRLYVYPDIQNQVMYILTIGIKDRQSEDINEAKAIVNQIKKPTKGI